MLYGRGRVWLTRQKEVKEEKERKKKGMFRVWINILKNIRHLPPVPFSLKAVYIISKRDPEEEGKA